MDMLWTPWRYAYITSADSDARPGVPARLKEWPGNLNCVFCNLVASINYAIAHGMSAEEAEEAGGLVVRGEHCFVCLNAFPYTSGHVMVIPYAHLDRLAKLSIEAAHEMMDLAQQTERALDRIYRPHGFNFGMNVGQAAGAGVAAAGAASAAFKATTGAAASARASSTGERRTRDSVNGLIRTNDLFFIMFFNLFWLLLLFLIPR